MGESVGLRSIFEEARERRPDDPSVLPLATLPDAPKKKPQPRRATRVPRALECRTKTSDPRHPKRAEIRGSPARDRYRT
jgi:hypothetical protein